MKISRYCVKKMFAVRRSLSRSVIKDITLSGIHCRRVGGNQFLGFVGRNPLLQAHVSPRGSACVISSSLHTKQQYRCFAASPKKRKKSTKKPSENEISAKGDNTNNITTGKGSAAALPDDNMFSLSVPHSLQVLALQSNATELSELISKIRKCNENQDPTAVLGICATENEILFFLHHQTGIEKERAVYAFTWDFFLEQHSAEKNTIVSTITDSSGFPQLVFYNFAALRAAFYEKASICIEKSADVSRTGLVTARQTVPVDLMHMARLGGVTRISHYTLAEKDAFPIEITKRQKKIPDEVDLESDKALVPIAKEQLLKSIDIAALYKQIDVVLSEQDIHGVALSRNMNKTSGELAEIAETVQDVYSTLWRPFGNLLAKIEARGVAFDGSKIDELEKLATDEKEKAEISVKENMRKYCEKHKKPTDWIEGCSLQSRKQLQQFFFAPIANVKMEKMQKIEKRNKSSKKKSASSTTTEADESSTSSTAIADDLVDDSSDNKKNFWDEIESFPSITIDKKCLAAADKLTEFMNDEIFFDEEKIPNWKYHEDFGFLLPKDRNKRGKFVEDSFKFNELKKMHKKLRKELVGITKKTELVLSDTKEFACLEDIAEEMKKLPSAIKKLHSLSNKAQIEIPGSSRGSSTSIIISSTSTKILQGFYKNYPVLLILACWCERDVVPRWGRQYHQFQCHERNSSLPDPASMSPVY